MYVCALPFAVNTAWAKYSGNNGAELFGKFQKNTPSGFVGEAHLPPKGYQKITELNNK